MLIVKCSVGSKILIGESIAVTVDLIVGGDACLTVDCPDDMPLSTSAQERVREQLRTRGRVLDTRRTSVLSTRAQPDLLIGRDVRIVVLPAAGSTVRIGIEAPEWMAIDRNGAASDARPGGGRGSSSRSSD